MNKFKIVGLAVLAASSMAFAQPWWHVGSPHGQVAFPWVADCKSNSSTFDESNENDPCYKTLGGWWFGYVAGVYIGGNPNGCRVDMAGTAPGESTDADFVKARIAGDWVSFVGPDYGTCEGPDISNRADGTTLLSGGGLEVQFSVGIGVVGPPSWDPSIAALAVNFSTPEPGEDIPVFEPKDMSQYGGFCLTYESDHKAADDFQITLGWDETGATTDRGKYDPWEAKINAGTGVQVQDFEWGPQVEKKAGDFIQEGWCKDEPNGCYGIEKAITEMMSFKIRLKSYEPAVVNFKLIQFGPKGTCTIPDPASAKHSTAAQNVNFKMDGKILSLASSITKDTKVQIFNLHGAVVQSKTLTPASLQINLSNLPSGVYMVRAPSLGYTGRIMIK